MAFYLQALKSWKYSDMYPPFTVGLIAASRPSRESQARSKFLDTCRKEQRDIQNFSQGIIEVRGSCRLLDMEERALVRSHSTRSSESDLQHETLNFEPGEGAWITVAHADHYF